LSVPSALTIYAPFPQEPHHHHLLILLHGWGADAYDLAPLAQNLDLPSYHFLFPNAPFPHPHMSQGKAWYALEIQDEAGLALSRQLLRQWLLGLESTTGIPLQRTILAGFSQGAAMALDVGLDLPLAGICSLSGYLHFQPEARNPTIPPLLIIHGRQDGVVPIGAARQARDILHQFQPALEYEEFDMGHEIPPAVVARLQTFVQQRTSP
jgi:phospholipase/carboxylesterase